MWRGLWKFITHDDEDTASRRLKRELYGVQHAQRHKPSHDPVTGEPKTSDPVLLADLVSSVLGMGKQSTLAGGMEVRSS